MKLENYLESFWAILGVLLISAATVLLVGCGESTHSKDQATDKEPNSKEEESKENQSPPEYKLRTRWVDIHASYAITINGFPVRRLQYKGRASDDEFNVPLNTALIGKENRASLRFEPLLLREGEELSLGMIEVEAEVLGPGNKLIPGAKITEAQVDSVYAKWSDRAQKKWKDYRRIDEQGALDSMRAWASRHPMTISATFDNEAGPDFSRIFEEAPRLPDTPATRERLRDYAMHLRDLMAEQDTSALVEEFLPVVWAGKDSLYTEHLRSNFSERQIQSIREHIVLEDAYLKIDRSEVGLRRWAEGRVWELYYEPDGNALFVARTLREGTPEYTGSGRQREVYVAEMGGELKVVR